MKLNKFLFWFLLACSIAFIPMMFRIADMERGFDGTGGEIIFLFIPIAMLYFRFKKHGGKK